MNLCELYITKQVDKACAKSIAEADIDIIGKMNIVLRFFYSLNEIRVKWSFIEHIAMNRYILYSLICEHYQEAKKKKTCSKT